VAGKPAVLENGEDRPRLGETVRTGSQAREAAPRALSLRDARALSETLLQESLKKLPRSVEIRMDPPELGKVTVLLSQRGQDVTVKFLAGTGEGQRALASALNDLERALSEKGLVLTGFSVDPGNRDQANREGRGDAGKSGVRKYPRVAEIGATATGFTARAGEGLFDRLA
jgi:flagellar hook-length control protein FliK